ncbi:berberine bridge enzyme-like C-1 precursor [Nicotiana tabacum]|uniref:Berberine bridge enzyme-like C-1 n=1 Tax=Nicotiana tabacum TaxID=4097 RepID=BBLC1_TOBAC|nr:berberine bridge enzyme-like C-1 precursor [Nicotiana tabacum]F1T161.1 RecName: Full=Berberine bridge enzyme-like C-1; Short=NtBBLc; Flags: Precursor [Nicotiana tabacum]BAK18780.1 berberine bridge enzyme-like protein [Nicotiana tabacum]
MFPLIILISFSFTFLSASATSGAGEGVANLSTCLINHNVHNFSMYPTSRNYFNLLDFSLQNLRFAASNMPKPTVIILPNSKEELVSTILCCRQTSYEIRVRCGGHSYEGTSSVSFDGSPFVIIDLMKLDDVSVDLDSETAWAQGGATIGQIYYAIAKASDVHAFSAGSGPTVGSGGHISGGGFGLLSRKFGVAADSVVDALLIDADGRLLDRKAMGEDVFWAIRGGGGGNWGIIYAWKIRLVKVPKIVTTFKISKPGSKQYVAPLLYKWQIVAPNLADDFTLGVQMIPIDLPADMKYGNPTPIEICPQFNGLYLGPKTEAVSILNEAFPELNVKNDDAKEMTWIESALFFSDLDNIFGNSSDDISHLKERYLGVKICFKGKSDYVKTPFSMDGIMTALVEHEKNPNAFLVFDPYGGAMDKISAQAIAFPHRKGNLFAIQYYAQWNEEDDAKSNEHIEWIRGFYNKMAPFVSSSPRGAYVNYLDMDLGMNMDDDYLLRNASSRYSSSVDAVERARAWGEKYFLNNYDRLVKAKTKIDPLNVFRHEQSIPPTLGSTQEHNYSSE